MKNEGIEKDDNDKDKKYLKRKRYNLFIFQKIDKNKIWTHIAYELFSPFISIQLQLYIKFYDCPYFCPDIFVTYDASII